MKNLKRFTCLVLLFSLVVTSLFVTRKQEAKAFDMYDPDSGIIQVITTVSEHPWKPSAPCQVKISWEKCTMGYLEKMAEGKKWRMISSIVSISDLRTGDDYTITTNDPRIMSTWVIGLEYSQCFEASVDLQWQYLVETKEDGTEVWSDPLDINWEARKFYTGPGRVQNVHQVSWDRDSQTCKVAWGLTSVTEYVDYYKYCVMNSKGEILLTDTTKNKFAEFKVNNNELYYIQVMAISNIQTEGNLVEYEGFWSYKIPCFASPKVTSYTFNNGKLKINWQKVPNVDTYAVYASHYSKGTYKWCGNVNGRYSSFTFTKIQDRNVRRNVAEYVFVQAQKKSWDGKTIYRSGWAEDNTKYKVNQGRVTSFK